MSVSDRDNLSQNTPDPQDLKSMEMRERLANVPVKLIERLREAGKDETLETVETNLEEEAEQILTEEIGLENYLPPDKFILPKSGYEDPKASAVQNVHGSGPENGIFISGQNSVLISTYYGELSGLVENNILSTSVHELVHNDTYNRLTNNEEVVDPGLLIPRIEDIYFPGQSFEDNDFNDSILYDLQRDYKVSGLELCGLSNEARDEISELSDEYNSVDLSERDKVLSEAYEVVESDIEVYHLNSPKVEPELESFAWLVSMYVENDLEEGREHLERDFSTYEKSDEIHTQLDSLVKVYDNLTKKAEMNQEKAVKYILEEVQPRKFDYKAKKIKENL